MDASNVLGHFEETSNDDIKSFFNSSPPLKGAAEIKRKAEEFMQKNSSSGKLLSLNYIFMRSSCKVLHYVLGFCYQKKLEG